MPASGELRAIVLHQPWAQAVAGGLKGWETRPPWAMRLKALQGEDLVICAGKVKADPDHEVWRHAAVEGRVIPELRPLAFGRALCVVTIGNVMPMVPYEYQATEEDEQYVIDVPEQGGLHARLSWGEYAQIEDQRPWGEWGAGRVAVELLNRRNLTEPVPVRGLQQVFRLPAAVEQHVLDRLP